ncbi:hypothetical protein ADL27_20380, partial [Streptomyces sp. NRRL F-6602]
MTTGPIPQAAPAPLPPWSVDAADQADTAPALGDLVAAAASRWPERPALHDGRTGLTFAALESQAQTLAAWLAGQGVKEIMLVSENNTSYGKDLGDIRLLETLLPELAGDR